MIKRAL